MPRLNPSTLDQSRRDFLARAATGAAGMALSPLLLPCGSALATTGTPAFPAGKAEHCIFIWLGGGLGQTDSWDPKRKGDPAKKVAGSYYDAIDTAVKDVQVCQHLSRCARLMDRMTLVRSVHHDVIDEHAAAVNRMHTGRPTSGTIVYPSIGSIVAHAKSDDQQTSPPYVTIGYPNVTRGPGFLGAKHGYLYLLDTNSGPAALTRSEQITEQVQNQRDALLTRMRQAYLDRNAEDAVLADYDATLARASRLSSREFMSVFDLAEEKADLRTSYGGEFGQRCLLSRRLVQRGVQFIEVSHNLNFVNGTGWDVHNEGILEQHVLIEELDRAVSTLIEDLASHQLLDKTLIVIAGEFGRPAKFDNGGGRGHQASTFSVALAGGGLQHGRAVGVTDELSQKILEQPVSVPDLFATIFWSLGIDPSLELYAGDRPVPVTDMGKPIAELFG